LKVEALIRATAVADGPDCAILLEQEPGSQSEQLVQHYKTNVLPEFNVIGVPAGNKNKVIKAQPFIASVESGNVFMVDNSSYRGNIGTDSGEPDWMKSFREEFGDFPPSSGGHDDQVDTAAICYNHLFQQEIKAVTWGRAVLGESRVAFGIGSYAKLSESNLQQASSLDSAFAATGSSNQVVRGVTWGRRRR
jgi:phage terminase large subunit-like protein